MEVLFPTTLPNSLISSRIFQWIPWNILYVELCSANNFTSFRFGGLFFLLLKCSARTSSLRWLAVVNLRILSKDSLISASVQPFPIEDASCQFFIDALYYVMEVFLVLSVCDRVLHFVKCLFCINWSCGFIPLFINVVYYIDFLLNYPLYLW